MTNQHLEETIQFKDLGFKLSVIQVLMYEKGLLEPKFDIYEFIDSYADRKIDEEEERYEPIPEAMRYFKDLPIPKRFAQEITTIYQDGGNEVYLNTCLECGGDEDYWDIQSIEDLEHFPNLTKLTLCYATEAAFEAFKSKGLAVNWL